MLIKRKYKTGEINGVRFINGYVSFGSVNLNVYCFEIDGVLIDTGSQSLDKMFKTFFEAGDFDKVLITHNHEDHTGGAAYIKQKFKVPIYINSISMNDCAKRAKYPLYRKLFWGVRHPFKANAIGNTFSSRNAVWDVIRTPGHARDHLSFLNRETKQLFTGDLYVHPGTKVILRDENVTEIIESLKQVLTYDFDEVYCCHAGYVKNGRKALMKKLNYLERLQERVLGLHQEGKSAREINNEIFKKKYPITYFSFGEWDSLHIITSIIKGNGLEK